MVLNIHRNHKAYQGQGEGGGGILFRCIPNSPYSLCARKATIRSELEAVRGGDLKETDRHGQSIDPHCTDPENTLRRGTSGWPFNTGVASSSGLRRTVEGTVLHWPFWHRNSIFEWVTVKLRRNVKSLERTERTMDRVPLCWPFNTRRASSSVSPPGCWSTCRGSWGDDEVLSGGLQLPQVHMDPHS